MRRLFFLFSILFLGLPYISLGGEYVAFYMDIWRYQNFQGRGIYTSSSTEIHLAVDGTSVEYRINRDSMYQASVNVDMLLQKIDGTDSTNVVKSSFNLLSMALLDTSLMSRRTPYLWVQKAANKLESGKYLLTVSMKDNYVQDGRVSSAKKEFRIAPTAIEKFAFSDIKLFLSKKKKTIREPGQRSLNIGVLRDNFVPFVTNATFVNKERLNFYFEIYNADYLLENVKDYYVRAKIMQNGQPVFSIPETSLKKSVRDFNYVDDTLNISLLPSGNYYLKIEIVDNTNNQNRTIRAMSKKFTVINSRKDPGFNTYVQGKYGADFFAEYDEEVLDTYLRTLMPISTEQEQRFIATLLRPMEKNEETKKSFFIELMDGNDSERERLSQKRNYLYSFWEKRKEQPEQSVSSLWKYHLTSLKYCDQHFSSALRDGWQTDRGQVFLKYKIPSDVKRFPSEGVTVPYEIWSYDRLDQQSNVIFVFYDPDLIDEYQLLHSSKYGEHNNPNWESQLLNRGRVPGNIDFERNKNQLRNSKLDPNHN